MSNRVQRALARRERMRRARDRAWMVFAGFAAAAVFGWILLVADIAAEQRGEWWASLTYAVIAVVSTYLAYRAYWAGKRLTRRLDEAQPLEDANWREISVWEEIWRRRT